MTVTLRPANTADLPAINAVIEAAVMTWKLPERVKRLALPSYRYSTLDMAHLHIVLAETPDDGIVGVAAWEPAEAKDLPAGRRGMLLHGLYVSPARWHQGIGAKLLDGALSAALARGMDGLLVKAQADAVGFFTAQGMVHLAEEDRDRHYVHRYWVEGGGR
jgi:GNAT superfamily N-acetyltransferase